MVGFSSPSTPNFHRTLAFNDAPRRSSKWPPATVADTEAAKDLLADVLCHVARSRADEPAGVVQSDWAGYARIDG